MMRQTCAQALELMRPCIQSRICVSAFRAQCRRLIQPCALVQVHCVLVPADSMPARVCSAFVPDRCLLSRSPGAWRSGRGRRGRHRRRRRGRSAEPGRGRRERARRYARGRPARAAAAGAAGHGRALDGARAAGPGRLLPRARGRHRRLQRGGAAPVGYSARGKPCSSRVTACSKPVWASTAGGTRGKPHLHREAACSKPVWASIAGGTEVGAADPSCCCACFSGGPFPRRLRNCASQDTC